MSCAKAGSHVKTVLKAPPECFTFAFRRDATTRSAQAFLLYATTTYSRRIFGLASLCFSEPVFHCAMTTMNLMLIPLSLYSMPPLPAPCLVRKKFRPE